MTIHVALDGTISGATLTPATDEQKAALQREAESMRQYGFITVSAQRPSPGVASLKFDGGVKPLEGMTRRVVLDETRINTHNAVHVDRLVDWLGTNGFERLDGEKLPLWMTERIKQNDAYGSAVVLPRGVSPLKLMDCLLYTSRCV